MRRWLVQFGDGELNDPNDHGSDAKGMCMIEDRIENRKKNRKNKEGEEKGAPQKPTIDALGPKSVVSELIGLTVGDKKKQDPGGDLY